MAITVAQLETYADAAAVAMAAGNYDTAIQQASAGLAVLGGIPEREKANASIAFVNARQSLTEAIKQARALKRAAQIASTGGAGIQRTKFKFTRPT